MTEEKQNEEITIEEVVKGLVLVPDYEQAKEYIARHKDVLFSAEARIIFMNHIGAQDGEFKDQLKNVLSLLDECRATYVIDVRQERKSPVKF